MTLYLYCKSVLLFKLYLKLIKLLIGLQSVFSFMVCSLSMTALITTVAQPLSCLPTPTSCYEYEIGLLFYLFHQSFQSSCLNKQYQCLTKKKKDGHNSFQHQDKNK